MLVDLGILQFIDWDNFSRIFLLTISFPAIFITYFLAKDSPSQAVFNYLTQIEFSVLIVMSCTTLNTIFHGTKLSDLLLRATIYVIVIIVELRYLRQPFRMLTNTLKDSWVTLCTIPIAFLLLLLVTGMFPEHYIKNSWAQLRILGTSIVMLIVYYVVFKSLLQSYSLMKSIREKEVLQTQVLALKRQSAAIHEQEKKLKIYRHDMRHYLQNIKALYEIGNGEKAAAVIQEVTRRVDETQLPNYCENDSLNVLFITYLSEAMQEGIRVTTKIDIPKTLPIDELDLSMVFANAIENAINACMKVPDRVERFIDISCICKQQLVIEISNSYTGEVELSKDGMPINHEMGHSVGIQSILSFAKKYNAIFDYKITETVFSLRILLWNE